MHKDVQRLSGLRWECIILMGTHRTSLHTVYSGCVIKILQIGILLISGSHVEKDARTRRWQHFNEPVPLWMESIRLTISVSDMLQWFLFSFQMTDRKLQFFSAVLMITYLFFHCCEPEQDRLLLIESDTSQSESPTGRQLLTHMAGWQETLWAGLEWNRSNTEVFSDGFLFLGVSHFDYLKKIRK